MRTCQTKTKAILIVEDDADIRNFVSRALQLEDYQVLGAEDGEEALKLARTGGVALMLLDLRLPVISGWSVLRQMRSDPVLSSIPVIVLTAAVAPSQQSRARALGAHYLRKPVSTSALNEAVAHILRRNR